MASLRFTRQGALLFMNIGFFRLPPHLKSRCLRPIFEADFLRVAYGAFGAIRTGKHGDFELLFRMFYSMVKYLQKSNN